MNLNGECPVSYALGDWSDGSGECCCDPYNQPGGNGQTTGGTPMPTGSTPTPTGLIPFLLTTQEPKGLMPYLLSSVGSTKEPGSTNAEPPTPATSPAPLRAEPLPSVPDYEPSSKPEPLKFCKCRAGVSTTSAPPTTPGLIPYLLTTNKPGLTPILLSSISSTSRHPNVSSTSKHPHLMTTRPSYGFTGMTSGSPSKYLRRRGHLLRLFL